MSAVFRNTLAVFAGLFIGSCVNMAMITVGHMVIPPPEGVNMSDLAKVGETLMLLEPVHFIAPWLAHAAGTLVGAFIAAKMAATHKLIFALGIGVFFLLGGIMMVAMLGGPVWFAVLDLVGAYFPMAFLGGRLGEVQSTPLFASKPD